MNSLDSFLGKHPVHEMHISCSAQNMHGNHPGPQPSERDAKVSRKRLLKMVDSEMAQSLIQNQMQPQQGKPHFFFLLWVDCPASSLVMFAKGSTADPLCGRLSGSAVESSVLLGGVLVGLLWHPL